MDGKGVKKLTNRVEKFDAFDHFSAGLDGICLGITGVNDAFRLRADAHRLSKLAILFPSTVPSFLSQQAKTSTSPLFLIVHRAARFWLPERINLWAKTCQHAWLIFQLNFFQRNFPHNVTGKCIPHADACCRSFSMNTHTTWFLACLPLSARCHPFPLEKRQSLETIAAYISSSSVHSVLSKDGCLSNFGNGFYQPLCYPG